MNPWDAPLIKKGMTAQFANRRARIAAGEKPLGWKVGLGAPASCRSSACSAPLVGYLMQRALLLSGSTMSLKGYSKPVAEPEIAVRMAQRSRPGRVGRGGRGGDQGDLPGDRNRRSRSGADAGQSRRGARRRHFPAPCRAWCGNTRRRRHRRPDLAPDPARRGSRAHHRSGSADRQAPRHRRACRQCRGGLRRKTFGRRRHHHRLDHAAGDDRSRTKPKSPMRSIRSARSRCVFRATKGAGQRTSSTSLPCRWRPSLTLCASAASASL